MAKKRSNRVVTITSRGNAAPGLSRTRVSPSPLGRFDPRTGRVYQKPRAKLNQIEGRSVRVTNPDALAHRQARKSASIGMGGAGQQQHY